VLVISFQWNFCLTRALANGFRPSFSDLLRKQDYGLFCVCYDFIGFVLSIASTARSFLYLKTMNP